MTPLEEGWQFRWGDSPAATGQGWEAEPWASPGWQPIRLPAQPEGRKDPEHLWMRVRLPAREDATTAVYVQYVDQNFEAFLDGKPLYRFGQPGRGEVETGRPFHLLPVGAGPEGVLALRVRSTHKTIGPFGAPVVGPRAQLLLHILRSGVWEFFVGLLLCAVGLAGLVAALALYHRERRLLWLGMLSLSSGVYGLTTVYSPVKQLLVEAPHLYWYLELGSVYLVPACYFGFYSAITQGLQRQVARGMCAFFALYAAGSLGLAQAGAIDVVSTLGPFHNLLTVAILVGLAMAARSSLKGSAEARFYLVGLLAVAVAGLHDVLMDERVLHHDTPFIVWGFLVFVAFLGTYVLVSFSRQFAERDVLAQRIAEQNRELTVARRRIAEAAEEIRHESGTVLEAASRQAATSGELAAANHETGATITEIAHISREATRSATTVVENAERSVSLSGDGEKAVAETVSAIERLFEQVSSVAMAVTVLADRTEQISGYTETAQELAEQSNLLALNASIEAAKAGEQGRGFAVVANEMRVLAEQSKTAAEKIRVLLTEVRKGTSGAIEASERSAAGAAEVVERARVAGESIASLASVIHDSARLARQIAQSSKEQTQGVDQVAAAVNESSGALDEALEGTRGIEGVARKLADLSEKLATLSRQQADSTPPA